MISQEIIKGTLKPIIIKLISENGRMYGYQITQRVKEVSHDKISITEGALYPALHKLVADKILVTETELIGKRARKYYKLSDYGKETTPLKLDEIKQSLLLLIELFDVKTNIDYAVE